MKNTPKHFTAMLIIFGMHSVVFAGEPTRRIKENQGQEKKDSVNDGTQTFTPPFQIGIGVGFNHAMDPEYDYYISATNGTLQRDLANRNSFVASVVVAYAIPFKYRQVHKDGKPIGELQPVPGPFSILSSFNIAEVNSSTAFNTSLSGGLGLGFNLNNVMHIGVFCDITKGRFLRSAYADSVGKKIVVDTTPLTSLDRTDNRFFKDGVTPSLSLKVVFVINRRRTDIGATSNVFNDKLDKAVGIYK